MKEYTDASLRKTEAGKRYSGMAGIPEYRAWARRRLLDLKRQAVQATGTERRSAVQRVDKFKRDMKSEGIEL